MNKIIIKKLIFFVFWCATWRVMIGPRGTPLVLVFFNRYLTEGLKPKVLQSAGDEQNRKCTVLPK